MSASRPDASSSSNPRRAPSFRQDPNQLVANPLGRNAQNLSVQLLDGGQSGGLDFETEARRETHGPQHAQMVFFKALLRIADGADDAATQIGQAVDEVNHLRRVQGRRGIQGIQYGGGRAKAR